MLNAKILYDNKMELLVGFILSELISSVKFKLAVCNLSVLLIFFFNCLLVNVRNQKDIRRQNSIVRWAASFLWFRWHSGMSDDKWEWSDILTIFLMLKCPQVGRIHTYSWLFKVSCVKKIYGMSSVVRKLSLVLSGITIALQHDWNMVVNLALRVHICYRQFKWTEVFWERFLCILNLTDIMCSYLLRRFHHQPKYTNMDFPLALAIFVSVLCKYDYFSCKPPPRHIFLIISVKI